MELIANPIANLLYEHRYIFAFLGALLEGTYIMILAGVLFKLGYFKFWGLIAVLGLGYFLNGFAIYLIGRFGGHQILVKWGRKLHLTKKLLEKLETHFKKHSFKTLFITRLTYGLSFASFIIAGSFKMKLKKFLFVNLAGTIVWVLGMFGLGYLFGVSYEALRVVTKGITIGLTIVLVVIIIIISTLIVYWLRRLAKSRFLKRLENNRFQFLRQIGVLISNSFDKKDRNEEKK
jgi:membrane protein DedA with SNARE-associated domain